MSIEMKTLYDNNFRYTQDGIILHDETNELTREIFMRFVNAGYNPREISHIMSGVLLEMELESILNKEKK